MTRVAGKSPANGAAKTKADAEKAARRAQAKLEKARYEDTITWHGETFRVAEDAQMPGAASLLLAHMANADLTTRDAGVVDGMWQILEMLLAQPEGVPPGEEGFDPDAYRPGEFKRFFRHFAAIRVPEDDLMDALNQLVEVFAARPPSPPGGSSAGPPPTTEKSMVISSAELGGGSST